MKFVLSYRQSNLAGSKNFRWFELQFNRDQPGHCFRKNYLTTFELSKDKNLSRDSIEKVDPGLRGDLDPGPWGLQDCM